MKELQQPYKNGMRWEYRNCVDCGKKFIAKNPRSVRCLDCRDIYHKEQVRIYNINLAKERKKAPWIKEARKKLEKKIDVIDEYNPNICDRIESCVYGGWMGMTRICDFLKKTGHKRPCKAGECVMYKRKGKDDE